MAIQTNRRNQVSAGRNRIMIRHDKAPRIGTTGTIGQRNLRCRLGWAWRNTMTPRHTSTKASRVPMLHISPKRLPGRKATAQPTATMKRRFDFHGVWWTGWMSEKNFGSNPSCDMVMKTRLWPISRTMITDEKPARMAGTMSCLSQWNPAGRWPRAVATGASLSTTPLNSV